MLTFLLVLSDFLWALGAECLPISTGCLPMGTVPVLIAFECLPIGTECLLKDNGADAYQWALNAHLLS